MSNQTIAVIGLGNMGGRMAANLAKAGLTVQGFDVSAEAKKSSKKDGVAVFDTAVEAAEGADVVITMLPNGDLVKKVLGSCWMLIPQPRFTSTPPLFPCRMPVRLERASTTGVPSSLMLPSRVVLLERKPGPSPLWWAEQRKRSTKCIQYLM